MDPNQSQSLPFVTRDMLAFKDTATFHLQINSQSNDVKDLTIRGMTKEGPFTFHHTTTNDGEINVETFAIPDVPILVSVIDTNNLAAASRAAVTLNLLINGDPVHQLAAGIVFAQKTLSWPYSNTQQIGPGKGNFIEAAFFDPAAGDEVTILVPAGRLWRIQAVRFTLVAAAAAASRRVHLVFTGADAGIIDCFSDIDQIISETKSYTCAAFGDTPDRTDDNDILIPIPKDLVLRQGSFITTETTNLNVGDNFGAPTVIYEEFFTLLQ